MRSAMISLSLAIPFPPGCESTNGTGHRSLAADECPKFSQSYEFDQLDSTRKPVSNTLNAFVNSPGGGTVYLGVLDNGSICGMLLTGLGGVWEA